jgi:AcrR family transcriptional regulator
MKARVREAASLAILEAAEQVAAERGLEATSTAAIAQRAEVAVGTLYNYFPDREALITALFKQRRDDMLPRIAAAAEATRGLAPEARLRAYLTAVLAVFEDYRRFCRVAMSVDHSGLKIRRSSVVLDAMTAAFADILEPLVRGPSDEYARMLFGALKALMQWRIEHDEPLASAAPVIADVFLHGISNP